MVSKEFEQIFANEHPERNPQELIAQVHRNEIKEFEERHRRHAKRVAERPDAKAS